ncbi:hypothetical protein PIB30_079530 [Stylosanthes scabra]|uniref:Transposase MuDR plant domain-containing protein n=1 Tax=Stylosanthes scabra TaxID=79078 RepID=A0ABU6TSH9_9FABA|nr:hypothetical protein [Stylosanthes scabra]
MGLQQLKDFILCSIGQDHRKRVQKIYYRYPHEVDGTFYFKRFHLRDDEDVALIRDWHIHLAVIPLLELYALLIDEGNNSEADSQSSGLEGSSEDSIPFSNQLVADAVDSHDESVVGDPTTHPYLLNHDSDNDDVDNEPVVFPQEEEDDDEEEEKEEEEEVQGVNYFAQTQPANAQPAISPDDDPVDEFEVGQEFVNKEAVVLAVKTYSIRRAVDYKILESDMLKYAVQCAQFG